MDSAMSEMNRAQLTVAAFHTGEDARFCLI